MDWRQMAFSFLREAQSDLNVALMLLTKKEFANSVEHSQHAVEEVIKSALFLKNIGVTNSHFVAEIFKRNFSEHPAVKEIVTKARALEKEGNRSQYPAWNQATNSVVSPYEKYDQDKAQKFYTNAEWIFQQIASYLTNVYQITLPDS